MNAAICWLDIVLLGLLAGNTLGAEVKETPGRDALSASFLLNHARVFDTANGQMRAGWSVLVISNRIAAVGPAAQVRAPTNAVVVPLADMALLPGLMDIHSKRGSTIAWFVSPEKEVNQAMVEPFSADVG